MTNIPKIKIEIDKEQDKKLFNEFLNHPDFPQHRNMILKTFPILKNLLGKRRESEAVGEFVDNFYKSYHEIINKITEKSRDKIENHGKDALKILGEIMNYEWKKPLTYTAKPTILPFSPYGDNVFYFSILPDIKKGGSSKNILEIALHEISHFIFLNQLEDKKIKLEKNTKYCIKEAVATAVLNQEEFGAMGIPKRAGNPEIKEIKIEINNEIYKLTDFISKNIKEKGYVKAIKNILELTNKASKEFSKRMTLWNQYGKNIVKNPRALEKYIKPIKL